MQLSMTNDPWFDRGLVLLLDVLKRCRVIEAVRATDEHHIFFELKCMDEERQEMVLNELKYLCICQLKIPPHSH